MIHGNELFLWRLNALKINDSAIFPLQPMHIDVVLDW
jgi:hypothetical protein